MSTDYYASYEHQAGLLICQLCQIPLEKGEVILKYCGNNFPVELPICKNCGQVFMPEELVINEMLRVEKAMEDK